MTPVPFGPVATASTSFSFGAAQTTAPASPSSGAGFLFGAGSMTSLAESTSVAPYSFVSTSSIPNDQAVSLSFGTGATSPVPAHGATVTQPSSTGFAFGSSPQLAGSATTAQSSTFSFGTATDTGGTPLVLVALQFGVALTNTFNPTLGGGATSSGASARRRAAKQIGRKK